MKKAEKMILIASITFFALLAGAAFMGVKAFRKSEFAEKLCLFYSASNSNRDSNLYIASNNVAECCFIGAYDYNGGERQITIPDEYNGYPIVQIGGYFGTGVPTPFTINLWEYMNVEEGSEYNAVILGDVTQFEENDNYKIEAVKFQLSIGKNVKRVEFVTMDEYFPHINEDGSITFYYPIVEINCAEENKWFYSRDGKLYDRKTEELVSVFAYE